MKKYLKNESIINLIMQLFDSSASERRVSFCLYIFISFYYSLIHSINSLFIFIREEKNLYFFIFKLAILIIII